jgi:phytoene dehydrogenase-like protein
VTRYRFADGTAVELSADLPRALEALEAWSPGAGDDWAAFLGVCARMWQASVPVLTGPPPWPPRRVEGRTPDPRDLLRVKPWHTLRTLARATVRDPRLRLVVERFATYAGADPRRAPAALAVAGYVEHAFGAWHPRGGLYELVRALVRALEAAGGDLRLGTRVERIRGRVVDGERFDAVVLNTDAAGWHRPAVERSLSGLALLLGVRGRTPGLAHHTITFPADYDAEFDDVFVHRRPVRDPTVYVSVPEATEGGEDESWFVLVNAPAAPAHDWAAEAARIEARLGVGDRVTTRVVRSPADLERETGAAGGAIYGAAPHGRLGTLKRAGNRVADGVWAVGGTVHPGGGLPLVLLGAQTVASEIGPA